MGVKRPVLKATKVIAERKTSPKSSAHRDRSLIQEKPDIEGSRHGFSPIAIPQSHAHTQLITLPPYENLSASSITPDCNRNKLRAIGTSQILTSCWRSQDCYEPAADVLNLSLRAGCVFILHDGVSGCCSAMGSDTVGKWSMDLMLWYRKSNFKLFG
jgi:hypothetical protein